MAGQTHDDKDGLPEDRKRNVKPGGTVGRDVPDERKEHHTEIAVQAGRTGGEHRDSKR